MGLLSVMIRNKDKKENAETEEEMIVASTKNSFYHTSMQDWRNVSIFAVMNPFEK